MSASDSMGAGKDGAKAIEAHLTTKHLISLIGLVVAVAAILVGSVKYKWSYDQIAATFFTLAVVVGLLNGMGINGTTKVFIGGCSKMVNAAFIVGFANGISVILASGNIFTGCPSRCPEWVLSLERTSCSSQTCLSTFSFRPVPDRLQQLCRLWFRLLTLQASQDRLLYRHSSSVTASPTASSRQQVL